jgi:hypothetical protein
MLFVPILMIVAGIQAMSPFIIILGGWFVWLMVDGFVHGYHLKK